jgi:CxxC-x17-CxxC domain-containing protein
MAKFDESKPRRNKPSGGPRRDSRRGSSKNRFGDRSRGSRDGPSRKEFTRVECSACGTDCEVPFRPTSNKPVYCDKCFNKDKTSNSKISENDLDIINEKLNKIMKALDIR